MLKLGKKIKMRKRKYDSDSTGTAKKSRSGNNSEEIENEAATEQPKNDEDTKVPETNPNKTLIYIKHFRKELAERPGQTMALTHFLQVCLNQDRDVDYMLEYLKVGGNSHEILRQISQDNKKNLSLATPAFHIFHLIIIKVQSSLPHMIAVTEEACRFFLNTFIPTVEIMISENAGPRHRKIILNLLTSMVTLNSDLGIEVLNQVPLTPKSLHYIVEKPNYKDDNVRTAFVHFMTSFLVDGHLPLIKALLDKQGLLPLVIPGLVHDEATAVLMFLNTLKKNIIDNSLITKTLKLKTFSQQVLHNMFKIFTWKGPSDGSYEMTENHKEIMALLSEIILTLFTSHKQGLYFLDQSLGTTDANKNQNLYKALLMLKRPWENHHQRETVLEIIHRCPDLHRAIINVVEQSFLPQHSQIWEGAIDFFSRLLDKLKPENMISKLTNLSSIQTANFVRFVSMPVPLLKLINASISKDYTISLYCVKVLVRMLQTLKRYMEILDLEDTPAKLQELKMKLDIFLPKHLPATNIIVSLIKDVINATGESDTSNDYRLPKPVDGDSLLSLLDLLLLYNYVYPPSFEALAGTIDLSKFLDFSMTISTGQVTLLKFKIISLCLLLNTSVLKIENPMFKNLFRIMLEVYVTEDTDPWVNSMAQDTLQTFFKNIHIFESNEDEIDLMLYTLRNSKTYSITAIANSIEYVLEHRSELSEYMRNQFVNFVISDELTKENLDKFFDDLMRNKNKDSAFLETKILSPYIAGCMQLIQSSKEIKKSLKSFLCLYITNLLHYTYSPELTEVLISDCKLDVRTYVADWTVQPVPIPETICEDSVLLGISKSIMGNEDVPVTNIFPLIESSEDIDINIMGVNYKIDITRCINSSDLFVWTKYLLFCVVRLTNMDQLSHDQQAKIINYYKVVIELGKKHHMINMCRHILLNLFRNAHFFKIYLPIDLGKNPCRILATEFLLQTIEHTEDLISYLNKNYSILDLYEEKTFSEIEKVFITINKRKNVSSDLIIKVLNIIGMSPEDDLKIFDYIFDVNLGNCFKEDREPSIVLDLLGVLVEKYSQSISLEVSNDVLNKCMKLYFDLLTLKETTPNLTKFEEVLVKYFESKPYRAIDVSYNDYKKFFDANTVRKTTSNLATVLLKFNNKFCIIFKDEINRPEILSQREITLPLGNVIVEHKQFLLENEQVLKIIYDEYRSNIIKFLEKPHKAGQVYINSTKLLKKLVVECMDIQDCEKLFVKTYKFEVAESTHIDVLHNVFLKLCLFEESHKKEYLINYFSSLLNLMITALKENKSCLIDILSETIINVIQVTKNNHMFQNIEKGDYKKITESGIWQSFCKTVLKNSLKVSTLGQENITESKLLSLLSSLVKFFYPNDHKDIVDLFEMVTSHSEFINVMLSHYSPDIKSRLIEFLHVLIITNKSVMKREHIPVYLSAYRATRSASDRLLLSILQFYEAKDLPVNEFKPYLWGDSAANHYAVRKTRTSTLWGHPTPNQVLNLFDKDIIENTIKHFPVNQQLDYNYSRDANLNISSLKAYIDSKLRGERNKNGKDKEEAVRNLHLREETCNILETIKDQEIVFKSHVEDNESLYDPAFLFPLLSHLLSPGSVVSSFKLLRSGLLSVPVMALSSYCPRMRAAAYHVLHRFYMHLETETRHKNDKLLLTDFIMTLRLSLSSTLNAPATEGELKDVKNPRLPAVGALYLARALMVCTLPSDPLYKPVNNFLIARQFVDLTVVPDFLGLFHDSDVETVDRKNWILETIIDGAKTISDVNVIFKTMCLKMIMDYYNTTFVVRKTKVKILNVISSLVAIPRAFEIMVEGYALITWLHYVVRNESDVVMLKNLIVLIRNMLYSLHLNSFTRHCGRLNFNVKFDSLTEFRVKTDIEFEILTLLHDLLPLAPLLDDDELVTYVELFNMIQKRSLRYLGKKQILHIINRCCIKFYDTESVKMIQQAVVMGNSLMLRSTNLADGDVTFEQRILKELKRLVILYVSA